MDKTTLTTIIDPDVKTKFSSILRSQELNKAQLMQNIVDAFAKKIENKKSYSLKYSDFERIKTDLFTCVVDSATKNKIVALSEKLDVSKRMVLRELLTDYIRNYN